MQIIKTADATQLTAATFILYGALVIGGGKATQAKVKKIFSAHSHVLFDVAEDMPGIRATFKALYKEIGDVYPAEREKLVHEAARFMDLNNTVVTSIRCLPIWWWKVALPIGVAVVGVCAFAMHHRGNK